jgi:hypothetical protein
MEGKPLKQWLSNQRVRMQGAENGRIRQSATMEGTENGLNCIKLDEIHAEGTGAELPLYDKKLY